MKVLMAALGLAMSLRLACAGEAVRVGNEVRLRSVRFTVLSPTLVRLEHDRTQAFEDRPSLAVASRQWPPVDFALKEEPGLLEITTSDLRLRYVPRSGHFNPLNLRIELLRMAKPAVWRIGAKDRADLGGTRAGLDGITGPVRVGDGVLSREGWFVINDSHTPLFGDDGWPRPRANPAAQDLYFFGYGDNYAQGLHDYNELCGPIPLLPRWAFGVWFRPAGRHHSNELIAMVRQFRTRGWPIDVLVLDHWSRNGWGSYDWDPAYAPAPESFLKAAHDLGVKVALRVHPGGALLPADSRYGDVCDAVGWDPQRRGIIFFDISNQKEAAALLGSLVEPLQRQGVDFWWVDGTAATTMRWLPNLWWTNYLFNKLGMEAPAARNLILGRYAGPGSQRFPVGCTGDFALSWDVLTFLTWFTATAGNVGMVYWANPVGGQEYPKLDDQLVVRSVQFGAFSPVMLLTMPPWLQSDAAATQAGRFLRLRASLVPYLYSLAHGAHAEGTPLCKPMYIDFPQLEQAYDFKNQYILGQHLLVAPITEPAEEGSTETTKEIWFPPGTWTDLFTGRIVEGPSLLNYPASLDTMPVFARAGAIIPLEPPVEPKPGTSAPFLTIEVYAGDQGQFVLYDRDDAAAARAPAADPPQCTIAYTEGGRERTVRIGRPRGTLKGRPFRRRYEIRLSSFLPVQHVEVNGLGLPPVRAWKNEPGWMYDPARGLLTARTQAFSTAEAVEITFAGDFTPRARELAYRLREMVPRLESAAILLRRNKASEPLIEKLRAAEARAERLAGTLSPDTAGKLELEKALADVRTDVAQAVALAVDVIRNESLKLEFLRVVAGISLSSRIVPTPYRSITIRNELKFLPYAWGRLSGQIITAGLPPHQLGVLEPEGGTFFETDLEVGVVKLAEMHYPVHALLEWNGLQLDLTIENVLDNTFLKQFYVIGPFGDGSYRRVTEVAFPPERVIDLSAGYIGKRREAVYWKQSPWQAPVPDHERRDVRTINLSASLKRMPAAAGYAFSQIYVPHAVEAKLLLGSEGGVVIWLNGIEIFRDPYLKSNQPDAVTVMTRLRAGWNHVLVKSIDEGSYWGFCLRLVGKDGTPIPGAVSGWGPGFER